MMRSRSGSMGAERDAGAKDIRPMDNMTLVV